MLGTVCIIILIFVCLPSSFCLVLSSIGGTTGPGGSTTPSSTNGKIISEILLTYYLIATCVYIITHTIEIITSPRLVDHAINPSTNFTAPVSDRQM